MPGPDGVHAVSLASFFAGTTAPAAGYFLYNDYKARPRPHGHQGMPSTPVPAPLSLPGLASDLIAHVLLLVPSVVVVLAVLSLHHVRLPC